MNFLTAPIIIIGLVVLYILSSIKILREYQRGVIFRLGRLTEPKGPGIFLIIPIVDRVVRIDCGPSRSTSRPGGHHQGQRAGQGQRGGVLPGRRPVEGRGRGAELHRGHLADRADHAAERPRAVRPRPPAHRARQAERPPAGDHRRADRALGREGEHRGDQGRGDPESMQRAMARQAEAERERRAKVIAAEGEFQASEKLSQAAEVLSRNPGRLQLRYLQTLAEIATEKNSTTVFPVPIELLKAFSYEKPKEEK